MSEAVSICNQTEWPFSFTDTYFQFDLELGRKLATRLHVFFFFMCVCYVVACVLFCALAGCRILLFFLVDFIRGSSEF